MGIPWRRALWPPLAALLLALLVGTATAAAAPLVVANPAGAGTVTLDRHSYPAGERITITGTGFTGTAGGTVGNPVIAVKVNDADEFPAGWTWGGPDAHTGGAGPGDAEEFAAFEVTAGAFSGWIDIAPGQGPWTTWLRFLGGALSTGDRTLAPTSFKAPIRIAGAAPTVAVTGGAPQPGGTLTVSLRDFMRADEAGGQKVAFKIDRAGDVIACVQTDAYGGADATIALPAGIAPGPHELNALAGSACGAGAEPPARGIHTAFTVTAPAPPPTPAPTPEPAPAPAPPPAPAPAPAPAPGPSAGAGAPTPAPKRVTKPKRVTAPALRAVTLVNRGTRARIVLRRATPVRTTITLTTAARVRLAPRGKPAVVTLARGVVKAKGRVAALKLTAKGKRYLATRRPGTAVRTKVVRAPKGGVRSAQGLVLRVRR